MSMGDMGMPSGPMPPMDSMSNDSNMGMGEPPMDGDMGDGGEESDPKKELQSLCGKLSEKLREYNDSQENPDTDLNKYIIGMILKQAAKDMTPHEKQDIIKDLEDGFDSEEMPEEGEEGEMPQDNGMPMESVDRVNETLLDNMEDDRVSNKKQVNTKMNMNRKNPFKSNRK